MVKIMGGPHDPRVQKLRETSRGEIVSARKEMRKAQMKVQAALSAEPFDEKSLAAALEELGEKGAQGREKAQAGVVRLATLMTPAERAQLRKLAARREERRGNGGPGTREKPAREHLKPPAENSPKNDR
jgi:Spy/CpxP family protein refolding chaperone